ncbi:MAG: hypothetical protein AAB319_00500 [Pseudomonadota bacterium]
MKNPLRTLPLCAGLAWACGQAFGQEAGLPADPTRPPSVASEAAPANANADPGVGAAAVGLQTIILRSGGKSMAVINGVQVKIGDKVGDATLVHLSETEAVLKGPSGRQVLRLTPGIEKHDSAKTRSDSGDPGNKRIPVQQRGQPNPAQ